MTILPKIVGILNITPDSFSDGGKYNNFDNALAHAEEMIMDGVDIIDIGAESTRPNAKSLSDKEEWERLEFILPQIIKLAHNNNILTSIDTYHLETAKKSIDLGIDIINDVSGAASIEMQQLAAASKAKIIIMHNLGLPVNPNIILDKNIDVVEHILNYAKQKIYDLTNIGIKLENIIFDPGVGFGKDKEQSWEIIKNIKKFQELNIEIFVGHSRKSFYNKFTQTDFKNRDIETYITSIYLAKNKVSYIRVHDVKGNIRALNIGLELLNG